MYIRGYIGLLALYAMLPGEGLASVGKYEVHRYEYHKWEFNSTLATRYRLAATSITALGRSRNFQLRSPPLSFSP